MNKLKNNKKTLLFGIIMFVIVYCTVLIVNNNKFENVTHVKTAALFSDVYYGAWYEDAIDFVYYSGIMTGVSSSKFKPKGTMVFGQAATVLYRIAGAEDISEYDFLFKYLKEEEPEEENAEGEEEELPVVEETTAEPEEVIPDEEIIIKPAYYDIPLEWARENNVDVSNADGEFRPKQKLTRDEFIYMLYKYAIAKGFIDEYAYVDYSEAICDQSLRYVYVNAAMKWAMDVELIGVDSDPRPSDAIKRAEAAFIIMRFMNCYNLPGIPEENIGQQQTEFTLAFIKEYKAMKEENEQ